MGSGIREAAGTVAWVVGAAIEYGFAAHFGGTVAAIVAPIVAVWMVVA